MARLGHFKKKSPKRCRKNPALTIRQNESLEKIPASPRGALTQLSAFSCRQSAGQSAEREKSFVNLRQADS
jgi:hypothetical protein